MSNSVSPIVQPYELAEILSGRRTIHLYQPTPVPRSLLLEGIDAARWAPNHKLTEPWRFYLIGTETAGKIAHLNAELVTLKKGEAIGRAKLKRWLEMPGWLAVTCKKSADSHREQEDYAACCCAVQNLSIFLWNHGIGMKWGSGGVVRDARFFELLSIDQMEEFVVGLFWYGYPAEVPAAKRREVDDIVRVVP